MHRRTERKPRKPQTYPAQGLLVLSGGLRAWSGQRTDSALFGGAIPASDQRATWAYTRISTVSAEPASTLGMPIKYTQFQDERLAKIGEEEGQTLLSSLVENSDAPGLAWFVKSMVGMDRTTAQTAFAEFLDDRSLNAQQMRFVEILSSAASE